MAFFAVVRGLCTFICSGISSKVRPCHILQKRRCKEVNIAADTIFLLFRVLLSIPQLESATSFTMRLYLCWISST